MSIPAVSERRMRRLVAPDGRSFMLALDAHSFSARAVNVDRSVDAVPEMAGLGLDAVLVPSGIASSRARELRDVALVLRCDASTDIFDASVPGTQIVSSALDGVRVGADALVVMTFAGARRAPECQAAVQDLRRESSEYGMPLIVESLPYSYAGTDDPGSLPENVAVAARLAEELGADLIKTRLSGTEADERILSSVHVPVVALGGPRTDLVGYLEYVSRCLDRGASGIAVGRNVVDDPDPVAKVAALAALIHRGAGVGEALAIYKDR
jgi:DhnA family fructose-bisphosphate aldolase class Ia